jgi:hypothetical protein
VAGIDRLLARGHGLFPASGGTGDVGIQDGGRPPLPPSGGELTTGATAAGDDYQQARAAVSALGDETSETADDGTAAGRAGRAGAGAVRDSARTQAAAIMPATNQPAGVKLMVSTMDQRLSDMQRQVDATNAQNRLLAIRLRQIAAGYQSVGTGPMGGRVPMSGFGGMPGGLGGGGLSGLTSLAGVPASLASSVRPAGAGIPGAAPGVVGRSVGGVLAKGVGSEDHLQKDTILAKRAISAAFPEITDIGGYRADSLPWHPNGQAIDCMIPDPLSPRGKALGDQVLGFALGRWKEFNLNHVIWQNRIWNSPNHSEPFGANWNDITQAHRNHVHVATNGGGFPTAGTVYRL